MDVLLEDINPGDVVEFRGNNYIAREDNTGVKPGVIGGDITGITNANPGVITSALHELYNGARILIQV